MIFLVVRCCRPCFTDLCRSFRSMTRADGGGLIGRSADESDPAIHSTMSFLMTARRDM